MSRARTVCGILSFCLSWSVCSRSLAADLSAATLVEKGTLTYGVAATFAPFEFQKDGALTGFDIDMISLLGKKLGAEPKPMNMEFKGLIPALQSKRIDIINSGMYIRPEREEQVDFIPYLTVGNEIVVQAKNPKGIKSREDMCGVKIAVTLGGFQEKLAREDDEIRKFRETNEVLREQKGDVFRVISLFMPSWIRSTTPFTSLYRGGGRRVHLS